MKIYLLLLFYLTNENIFTFVSQVTIAILTNENVINKQFNATVNVTNANRREKNLMQIMFDLNAKTVNQDD